MRRRSWWRSGVVVLALGWLGGGAAIAQPAGPPLPPEAQAAMKGPALGEEHRVKAEDIDKLLARGDVVLLDVREPWELEKFGTLEGYLHIPLGQLEKRLDELPKDKAILTA
jgi:hypothetical protein